MLSTKMKLIFFPLLLSLSKLAWSDDSAFKIGGKSTSFKELSKEEPGALYKIERDKYDLITRIAQQKYLDYYWEKMAKKDGKTAEQVKADFAAKNFKVDDAELKKTMAVFKDHPQLKSLPQKEQEDEVRNYLAHQKSTRAFEKLFADAKKSGELVITYPEPEEPVYQLTVTENDHVRYGPSPDDIKPAGCSADCKITVVEYSDFECPFCSRVMPTIKSLLTEYKGKIRWIVRDYPLPGHRRAIPAAIAAHCAGQQGKFWNMYTKLFENQRQLSDKEIETYAGQISGLDKSKWSECLKSPEKINAQIAANTDSGKGYGVDGTPAFFVNGRKLSGAVPIQEFKSAIEDTTKGAKK